MRLALLTLIFLSNFAFAALEEKPWPTRVGADDSERTIIGFQAIAFDLGSGLTEIGTADYGYASLLIKHNDSYFSIFYDDAEKVLGVKEGNPLVQANLYSIPLAMEYLADNKNKNSALQKWLFDGKSNDVKKYHKKDWTAYLWNPPGEAAQLGVITIKGDDKVYRFVGTLSTATFERILETLGLRG